MVCKKRILIGIAALLILLAGVSAARFCRSVRQARKNQELIAAIKAGNRRKALDMLAEGADGGARDTGPPVSMGVLVRRLLPGGRKQEDGEKHLPAVILLYQQANRGSYGREPDPQLTMALLGKGARLNKQDMAEEEIWGSSDSALNAAGILYQRAEAEYPTDPDWPDHLGSIYRQKLLFSTGNRRRKLAALAQAAYDRALPHLHSPDLRTGVLTAAAYCAFEAADLDRAHTCAEQAVKEEALRKSATLNEGNSVYIDANNAFYCHLLLGRIALRKGDRNEAKRRLLTAGEVTVPRNGFCWLGPFGQTSPLAQELLEKGERKTVLKYFQRCNKSGHDSVLAQWSQAVQSGKIPDFCPIP